MSKAFNIVVGVAAILYAMATITFFFAGYPMVATKATVIGMLAAFCWATISITLEDAHDQ